MNSFKINGKHYTAKPLDFNTVCDLEDLGVSMVSGDTKKKPMALVRAYFALHLGGDTELAGKEMESHVLGGGTFEEIMDALGGEIEKSGFFRSLSERKTEKDAENQEETKALPKKE